ncbi:hypothetical protein TA3x_000373 [Tundrisphaera sp. TA3]|uniref:hypothetical protein n=1 Tax=Tundrisphaera sp. TA3 TaxID=3435775 RepID=UPI003EB7240B
MILPPTPSPDTKPLIRVPIDLLDFTESREDVTARRSFPALVLSMQLAGVNLVPVFFSKLNQNGRRKLYDGNGRGYAGLAAGNVKELVGIEVDDDLDEIGLIDFGATHNGVRRTMTPEDWGIKAERLMELTGCTQEDAALRLHISAASISRALTSLLLPEKHKDKGKLLANSTRAMIAAIKSSTVQDRVMEFASTKGADGRLPSRDAVAALIKRLNSEGKVGRKARQKEEVKIPKDSPIASLAIWADIDPKALAKALKDLAKVIDENAANGLEVVLAMLRSKDRPGDGSTSPVTA